MVPDTVFFESDVATQKGYDVPDFNGIDWLEIRVLNQTESEFERDFAMRMGARLERGGKDNGECAVMALAAANSMVAVLDDGDARTVAYSGRVVPVESLRYITTMWIIAQAYNQLDDVDAEIAERIYSDLRHTGMCLPVCDSFMRWAREEMGYIEY